jgi:hypothetical protein
VIYSVNSLLKQRNKAYTTTLAFITHSNSEIARFIKKLRNIYKMQIVIILVIIGIIVYFWDKKVTFYKDRNGKEKLLENL